MATAMATSSIVATAPCPSSSSSAPPCSLRSALPLAVRFSSCASLRSGGSLRIQFVGSRGVAERRRGAVTCSLKKLAEVESVELTEDVASSFPAAPGIYAVYDKVGDLQYIGLSRRISASLQTHSRDLPELCASAKFAVIDAPERSALTDAWKAWMEEHINSGGNPPSGNAKGNTQWTARKARSAKPEIKLTPGAHVKLNVPIETLIDKVVKELKVVAFIKGTRTAPQCGFSHRVLTILNEQGADYEVLNVLDEDHNPGLREAIKKYSQWPTIPQLYVKGEFVGGADVLDEMVLSGEIKDLFKN
ncbi:hypothetical protein M758_6G096500 [Ceratodon purpureus]|nr:hypothetical protein M758_6G096500 [Ceratodon purpureus]